MTEKPPIIEDPVRWQYERDHVWPASINLYGSQRFWATVQQHLGRPAYTNGAPEFDEVVIALTDSIGVRLTATVHVDEEEMREALATGGKLEDACYPDLEFAFVSLDDGDMVDATQWRDEVLDGLREALPDTWVIKNA